MASATIQEVKKSLYHHVQDFLSISAQSLRLLEEQAITPPKAASRFAQLRERFLDLHYAIVKYQQKKPKSKAAALWLLEKGRQLEQLKMIRERTTDICRRNQKFPTVLTFAEVDEYVRMRQTMDESDSDDDQDETVVEEDDPPTSNDEDEEELERAVSPTMSGTGDQPGEAELQLLQEMPVMAGSNGADVEEIRNIVPAGSPTRTVSQTEDPSSAAVHQYVEQAVSAADKRTVVHQRVEGFGGNLFIEVQDDGCAFGGGEPTRRSSPTRDDGCAFGGGKPTRRSSSTRVDGARLSFAEEANRRQRIVNRSMRPVSQSQEDVPPGSGQRQQQFQRFMRPVSNPQEGVPPGAGQRFPQAVQFMRPVSNPKGDAPPSSGQRQSQSEGFMRPASQPKEGVPPGSGQRLHQTVHFMRPGSQSKEDVPPGSGQRQPQSGSSMRPSNQLQGDVPPGLVSRRSHDKSSDELMATLDRGVQLSQQIRGSYVPPDGAVAAVRSEPVSSSCVTTTSAFSRTLKSSEAVMQSAFRLRQQLEECYNKTRADPTVRRLKLLGIRTATIGEMIQLLQASEFAVEVALDLQEIIDDIQVSRELAEQLLESFQPGIQLEGHKSSQQTSDWVKTSEDTFSQDNEALFSMSLSGGRVATAVSRVDEQGNPSGSPTRRRGGETGGRGALSSELATPGHRPPVPGGYRRVPSAVPGPESSTRFAGVSSGHEAFVSRHATGRIRDGQETRFPLYRQAAKARTNPPDAGPRLTAERFPRSTFYSQSAPEETGEIRPNFPSDPCPVPTGLSDQRRQGERRFSVSQFSGGHRQASYPAHSGNDEDLQDQKYSILQGFGGNTPARQSEDEYGDYDDDEFFDDSYPRRRRPANSRPKNFFIYREAAAAIPKFRDGLHDYINWLAAVQYYEQHCPDGVTQQIKFQTAMKTLEGKARRIGSTISIVGQPFDRLLANLQKEFGEREQILVNQKKQIVDMRPWPKGYNEQRDWLSSMEAVKTGYEVFGGDIDTENALYLSLFSKLYSELRQKWVGYQRRERVIPCWSTLLGFLQEEADMTRQLELENTAAMSVTGKTAPTTDNKSMPKQQKGANDYRPGFFVAGTVTDDTPADGAAVTMVAAAKPQRTPSEQKKSSQPKKPQSKKADDEPKSDRGCEICGGSYHSLHNCEKFQQLSVPKRMEAVLTYNYHAVCLSRHVGECRRKRNCEVEGCNKRHHTMLHDADFAEALKQARENKAKLIEARENATARPTFFSTVVKQPDTRLLRLARVAVRRRSSMDATMFEIVVLIDSAANQSVVDERLCRQLKVPLKFQEVESFSFHGTQQQKMACVDFEVRGFRNEWWPMENVTTTPSLKLPSQEVQWSKILEPYAEMADIKKYLSDCNYSEVRMIIGLDKEFIHGRRFTYPEEGTLQATADGRYYAYCSGIGWLATGVMMRPEVPLATMLTGMGESPPASDEQQAICELTAQFSRFQHLEDLGVATPPTKWSPAEEDELHRMQKSIRKAGTQVQIEMLWKLPKKKMPPSEVQARKRLSLLWKRLDADEQLKIHYVASVKADLEKGYIRKLSPMEVQEWQAEMWVLPHFPVYHPDKPHKVRRVCDAAAKNYGVSLNSQLEQGPNNISSLVGVLMRFRQGQVAIQADIEEMFSRFAVYPEDQKRLVFLWQESGSSKVEFYAYTCHIFGAKCSPAVANFAVGWIFQQEGLSAVDRLVRRFYMDDFFCEADSEEEAFQTAISVREALAANGLVLSKWVSNRPGLAERISVTRSAGAAPSTARLPSVEGPVVSLQAKDPPSRCPSLPSVRKQETGIPAIGMSRVFSDKEAVFPAKHKVLGVKWQLDTDMFTFATRADEKKPETAAEVLSMLASIFDPLGIVAPFVLSGKLLMRKCWSDKKEWRTKISDAVLAEWNDWALQVPLVASLSIPRWYGTRKDSEVELHVFADASDKGYGCVAYFRFNEPATTSFVAAKSRLNAVSGDASVQATNQPIARVELQACLLAFRHACTIVEEVELTVKNIIIWTDSQVTYWWTRNHRERYVQFVRNRLKEIYEIRFRNGPLSKFPTEVLYVPTDLNPADLVSRGTTGQELCDSFRLWSEGPDFLRQGVECWPKQPTKMAATDDKEVNFQVPAVLAMISVFTDAERAVRLLPYLQLRSGGKELGEVDVQKEENELFRAVQEECFQMEMDYLKKNCAGGKVWVPKFSRALRNRRIFLDSTGVMRMETRLECADFLEECSRYPVVMPNNHPVTDLLYRDAHHDVRHTGAEATWAKVCERFHVPRGKKRCGAVVSMCKSCRRWEPVFKKPPEAVLHKSRLNVRKPLWWETGMDFFGPYEVVSEGSVVKRYGLIFIDLTSRAIHLESCNSLETDSLLLAIERFRSVRGTPKIIRSDNGTTFHGANNEIKRINAQTWKDLQRKCKARFDIEFDFKFEFNPPYAPHWGGSWERMIKEVKRCLHKALGLFSKKSDELWRTALYEAMWALNQRPLTVLEDGTYLTPAKMLAPASRDGVGLPLLCSSRKVMKYLTQLLSHFWTHFVTGYLGELGRKARGRTSPGADFKVGDAVVVKDKLDFGQWLAGTVVQANAGPDGEVRALEISTKDGIIRRDVSLVAPCDLPEWAIGSLPKAEPQKNPDKAE